MPFKTFVIFIILNYQHHCKCCYIGGMNELVIWYDIPIICFLKIYFTKDHLLLETALESVTGNKQYEIEMPDVMPMQKFLKQTIFHLLALGLALGIANLYLTQLGLRSGEIKSLSPYSTGNEVRVGHQTQMKSTQKK